MRRVGSRNHRASSLLVLFALCLSLLPPAVSAQTDGPPVAGSLVIHVVGSDSVSLDGATFDVTDANGATQTVASVGGAASVFNLAPGEATVAQTSTPAG